jgi:hypothetical protein
LKDTYGYNHPPRAVRDVREYGIPIITYRIKGTDGRNIAAYKFGDESNFKNILFKKNGRTILSKILKQSLIDKYGAKCFIYLEYLDENLLQVDHRIPYEISGDQDEKEIDGYMLISPSVNRAKSWTCEHCKNWEHKKAEYCATCFFAHPENYTHIAGKQQKIISIIFTGNEIEDYNRLIEISGIDGAQQVIKNILHDHLK